jgi:MMP 1-O-methyltransferase
MASVAAMDPFLLEAARHARGFMPDDEGLALFEAGARAARFGIGPLVEVGAYCGKSTIYLGAAARESSTVLYSLDHHRGSEENQAGWAHHEPDLVDPETGRMDTLPHWRRNVAACDLESYVVGLIGDSPVVAKNWATPLALVFIDGGHGEEPAWADYRGWAPHVARDGLLVVHDVFADPADGGRPPYEIWCQALRSGAFAEDGGVGSLRVLRRVADGL